MKLLKTLDENFEEYFLMMVLPIMTLLASAQIVFRYFLNFPLGWTEEVLRYLFIWLVYISISLGVKKRKHIKVDLILLLLPKKGKFIMSIFSNIMFILFAILISYYGYKSVFRLLFVYPQHSASIELPLWIPYLSVPFGLTLTVIRLIQDCIKICKENLSDNRHVPCDTCNIK